jgi:hypothetical protein
MKQMFVVTLLFCSAIFSQKNTPDSANTVLIPKDKSLAVRLAEKQFIQLYSRPLTLFEFHRPNYVMVAGLLPKYQNWKVDNISLSDNFSGLSDYNHIKHTFTDSAHFTILNQSYQSIVPTNQTAFSKLNLFDGDYLYANVDMTYYQRISEKIGLYLSGNTREATSRSEAGTDFVQFRSKLDYHLSSDSYFSLLYHTKELTASDYGFVEDEVIQSPIDRSYRFREHDERETLSLDYHIGEYSVYALYSYQAKQSLFTDSLAALDQTSYRSTLGIKDTGPRFNSFAEIRVENIQSNYFSNNSPSSTTLNLGFSLKKDRLLLRTKASVLLEGESRTNSAADLAFQAEGHYSNGISSTEISLEQKRPSLNEAYLLVPSFITEQNELIEQPFFKGFGNHGRLNSETAVVGIQSFNIGEEHRFSLLANYIDQPILYSLPDSAIINAKMSSLVQFQYFGQFHLYKYLGMDVTFTQNFLEENSAEAYQRGILALSSRFRVFKQLDVSIRLAGNYLAARPSIYYLNYGDVFALDTSNTLDPVVFATLEATFKIRSATFRLLINNGFSTIYQVVRGYEAKARGVQFGVEWTFYD